MIKQNRNALIFTINTHERACFDVGTDCKSAPASGNTAGYVPNTGQYLYDANANMTYDPSKKINVSYNHLNLPRLVEFDNDDHITYTYTATGSKLRKTVTSWKTTTGGTTDYSGQFLYQDNELMAIFTPNGRLVPVQYNDETFWKHEYNLTDHLGNVRVVFAAHNHGQPEVMQQTSYYPFGMTLQQQNFGGVQSQPNKLLYNSKELQDDELAGVSLDWYDYGARMYDAQIARFHSVDPLAEKYFYQSPFTYAVNNPIRYIDFLGMGPRDMEDVLKAMGIKQGYTITTNSETQVTTISRTEVTQHPEKMSTNSEANYLMSETMFTIDGDGNTVSVISTESEINATFTAEQDELFNRREVADVKTEQTSSKAFGAKFEPDKVSKLTKSDPIANGVSNLIKSPNSNEFFSGSMSLPGTPTYSKIAQSISNMGGFGLITGTKIHNGVKLNINFNKAKSAEKKLLRLSSKTPVLKM